MLRSVDELDLLVQDAVVAAGSRTLLDMSPSHPSLLLSGLSPSPHSLRLHDLTSKAVVFSLPPRVLQGGGPQGLHALAFLHPQTHPHSLVSCSQHGEGVGLEIWDYRQMPAQPSAATRTRSAAGATPTQCSLSVNGKDSPSPQLAVLTEAGSLAMYDSRNLHGPMATCQLSKVHGGFPSSYSSRFGSSHRPHPPSPCVQVSAMQYRVF